MFSFKKKVLTPIADRSLVHMNAAMSITRDNQQEQTGARVEALIQALEQTGKDYDAAVKKDERLAYAGLVPAIGAVIGIALTGSAPPHKAGDIAAISVAALCTGFGMVVKHQFNEMGARLDRNAVEHEIIGKIRGYMLIDPEGAQLSPKLCEYGTKHFEEPQTGVARRMDVLEARVAAYRAQRP